MGEDALKGVTFVEGDITDQARFEQTVVENGITHIVHLAALQVPFVRADPVQGMRVNVVGSTIVFETAKRHAEQVKGLVYASSIGVYGPAKLYPPGPIAHDAPLLPATLYGVSKMTDEWMAKVYWQDYQLRSVGIRPAFVYGPARDQGVTSTPTKAMLAAVVGRPYHITLGGNGLFQHADDVAKALIMAARARLAGAPCHNLGGTKASMAEVVAAIEAAAPEATGTITYEPNPHPFAEDADGRPLEEAIGPVGWRPFAEGVRGTIADFRAAVAAGTLDVERAIA
jgi:nucleoside-diphosphate-sugar epimerase